MKNQSFNAGAAKVDITPPLGTFINGDFVPHFAQFIHDKLYAKALVMQDGKKVIAIVVVDICVLPKDFLDNIKTRLNKSIGMETENILISATHTHAAGSIESVYLGAADLQYMRKLPEMIIEAVTLAKSKLRPAQTAWGSSDVPQHVLCRRYQMMESYTPRNPVTGGADLIKTNPFGAENQIVKGISPTDPQVSFLGVKGIDDKWISVVGNYSLHYVGDWDNGTISSDYFGQFSKQLAEKLHADADFVGMMSNGTSGDINIWDFQDSKRYPSANFEKSYAIGGEIAEVVTRELLNSKWEPNPALAVQYEEVTCKLRKPSPEELEKAKVIVSQNNYENMIVNDKTLPHLYAREQVLLSDLPESLQFPVHALRIGKGIIGGLGGEIFASTGLWIKENSPEKTYFTIGLANANAGYVPPPHEHEKGGYETWRSRTSKLETGAEEVIREKLLELIKNLTNYY